MPRDPRGPEYGDPSRLERVLTTLLVLGAVLGVALVALAALTDVVGTVAGIGPAWVTVPLAIALLAVIAVLLNPG